MGRSSDTIASSLTRYEGTSARGRRICDEFTPALTFGYNCRIHSSLGLAPFELVLSRPPPPLSVECPEPGTADTPETAKVRFLKRLEEIYPAAQRRLADAQARYKENYDRSVREKNKDVQIGS
jgi:hypothetical protein